MSVVATAPGGNERTVTAAQPGPPVSQLVSSDLEREFTAAKETDTRTAITRGLAEYISQFRAERPDGRILRFQKTFESWAEPEDVPEYPSAIAYTTTPGIYEASRLTPIPSSSARLPSPDKRYVMSPAEYVVTVTVEFWCTDDEERMGLVAAAEDAFNPFAGSYGFSLQLPHYHNARATYEPTQMGYMDNEVDAIGRLRKAVFALEARVPLIKLVAFPEAKPRIKVSEVGPNVVVDVTATADP